MPLAAFSIWSVLRQTLASEKETLAPSPNGETLLLFQLVSKKDSAKYYKPIWFPLLCLTLNYFTGTPENVKKGTWNLLPM